MKSRRIIQIVLLCLLPAVACTTYGAYKLPLMVEEGVDMKVEQAQVWVATDLEVLEINGEDFLSNLNRDPTWWYYWMGYKPYALHEFFIAPGSHEIKVRYKVEERKAFFKKDVFVSPPYSVRVNIPAGDHVCICYELIDASDRNNVSINVTARKYDFPDDFIPEGVYYVEGLTKLLVPPDCFDKNQLGKVVAKGRQV